MFSSLLDHNRGYQLTFSDALLNLATGCSGRSYAKRHFEMGHRLVSFIESMPLVGAVALLVERLAYALFGARYSTLPYKDLGENQARMQKGLFEACQNHVSNVYATFKEVYDSKPKTAEKLTFTCASSDDIGPRPKMEDAKFIQETDDALLAGVFDGHGGSKVSQFAAKEFSNRFSDVLKGCNGDVAAALETLLHQIHQDVVRHSMWNTQGSTAVVTYIDKKTNEIYTATLGDSEANLYRKIGWVFSRLKSIPLSVVRDWAHDKEFKRLQAAHKRNAEHLHAKRAAGKAKKLYSRLSKGVNVSRALGDVSEAGSIRNPLVIHKPKITKTSVKKGDTLVLACDGLKDYVPEEKIVEIVGRKPQKLAGELVKEAIHSMRSDRGDNVTVVTIEVK